MSTKVQPLAARCARWLLGCALRHWPDETRPWGLALAAEIDEAANVFETVRWLMGGIMFFARSLFTNALAWMKLPAGCPLPSGVGGGPVDPSLLPGRSRLFTAAILVAAAVVLFLPEGREAITTVWASWHDFHESPGDRQTLEKLAARAEKEKDASTLAFVGLRVSDPERAAALCDRAVSIDPEFAWVYGARTHWPTDVQPRKRWLEHLQAFDQGNAVPDLLAADALAEPRLHAVYERHSPADKEIETLLANDPKWMALMERAFREPRYDGYFRRHSELTRMVWNRERYLSPTIVLMGLWSHSMPNLLSLKTFSEIKIHKAQEARAAGNLNQGENLLSEVDSFGERMVNGGETKIEKLMGLMLVRNANHDLAALYTSAGRNVDAQSAELQVQQIEERLHGKRPGSDPERVAREQTFRRRGILVQVFGSLATIAAFAALTGIILLELWPARFGNRKTLWRRGLCLAADFAPGTLLVASSAFLLSFLPYARVLAEYRSSNSALPDQEALWSLFAIPNYVLSADGGVRIWTFVTVALAALAVFIVARSFYRARRAQPNHV